MLAALALAYVIIGPGGTIEGQGTTAAIPAPPPVAATVPAAPVTAPVPAPHPPTRPKPPAGHCSVPASLPPAPGVAYEPMKGPLPADLPGPTLKLPEKIDVPLNLYLPPPAPFGSQIHLGQAEIDLKTGSVVINGQNFSPGSAACP